MPSLKIRKIMVLGCSFATSLLKAWARFRRVRCGDVLGVISSWVLTVRLKRERWSNLHGSEA
jgi:hypothetical protein